jgi:hypothetical protein
MQLTYIPRTAAESRPFFHSSGYAELHQSLIRIKRNSSLATVRPDGLETAPEKRWYRPASKQYN